MKPWLFILLVLLILAGSVNAATLQGNIYDLNLTLLENVLIEINTEPKQQYLAIEGKYSLELPPGKYVLKAKKGNLSISEEVKVSSSGKYLFDLFLFPDFDEEDELSGDVAAIDVETTSRWERYPFSSYLIAAGIFLVAFGRIVLARKKYKKKKDTAPLLAEEKPEPKYLEETLEIIRKHEGRISQKDLRQELMHLSEAKVSLILTELEHKSKIEKIKKGRGNIILLK